MSVVTVSTLRDGAIVVGDHKAWARGTGKNIGRAAASTYK